MARKVVGIIPARWGSTRFPGKPLHAIGGKPLLQHVWERCRRAKLLDSIIVATDDIRIAEAAFDWGAEVAITSAKHRSGTDRVAEVVRTSNFSHIINIQGDEPLTNPKLIDRLVRRMQEDRSIEMITAAHPFEDAADVQSPHQVKVVLGANGRALYFSRSPIPFMRDASAPVRPLRHQGIYGYTRNLLLRFVRWKPSPLERAESLEQLRALEHGISVHVVITNHGSPGVDTPDDAAAIDALLSQQRNSRMHLRKASS